jgi:hypothetical protein
MNADTISRMLVIENEIKEHESSLVELRKEGQGLFTEVQSWGLGLTFAAAPKAAASKTDGRKDDVGLKLAVKRSILKSKNGGSPRDVALTVAAVTAQKFVEKKGISLPTWVAEWTERFAGKTFLHSEVETPVAEISIKEVEPEGTEAPKPTKKRKK